MKIAVAMSGGVDSSVAAIFLKNMGHDVVGITAKILLCADMDGCERRYDVCCSPESMNAAREIARSFSFPHVLVDVEEDFSREIIDPFCREYLAGRTPSPCIHCNARVKFRKLIEFAASIGCEKLATGHYARLGVTESGRHYVSAGVDGDKDQSYFLFMLGQDILRSTIFPLGDRRKEEIRVMASDLGLAVADRPESQEICFVQDNDYPRYIERRTGCIPPPGEIVSTDGKILGRHRGIHRYTIGQRRGLGIAAERPLYVVEIDAARNVVVAGFREDLFKHGLYAREITLMKSESLDKVRAFVKTRSTQQPFAAALSARGDGIEARFTGPQAGITPGQAAVFYDESGDVLGGGWIESAL
ncbi:MAG TPA: tRNA 2-thiouridine(34) synthase MnmA [Spirochaetota bacterium]|nr:tRNA 2-thiouridine(34) synthase MnmA [Spirochaetota bacterium]